MIMQGLKMKQCIKYIGYILVACGLITVICSAPPWIWITILGGLLVALGLNFLCA